MAQTYVSSHRPTIAVFKKLRVLKELRKNKNILILKPDKENDVVVLDRSDYDQGIFKIINDTSKFRPIKEDSTLLREGRLRRILQKVKKNGHLDKVVYENIYPKGSQPAKIYGLPKMHKIRAHNSSPPFCPIVSLLEHTIMTWLHTFAIFSPHIPTEHCATDTFSFVQEIQSSSTFGKFMVFFDVESLFTNIPLEKCIDLEVNYNFRGQVEQTWT